MNMAMKNSGLGIRARALFLICLCGVGLMFSTVAYGGTTVTITTDVSGVEGGRNANADGDGTSASVWTGTAAVDDATLVINGSAKVKEDGVNAISKYDNGLIGGFTIGDGATVTNSSVIIGVDGGDVDSSALVWDTRNDNLWISGGLSLHGNVTGNSVTINQKITNDKAMNVYGGRTADFISGPNTITVREANNNTVLVLAGAVDSSGATVEYAEIAGGFARDASGSASAVANDNTVTIGAGVEAMVVAGGKAHSGSANATASNNTVNLLRGAGNIATTLHGGSADARSGTSVSLNNTLNVVGYSGSVGSTMGGFQKYNFFLDEHTAAETPILSVPTLVVSQETGLLQTGD